MMERLPLRPTAYMWVMPGIVSCANPSSSSDKPIFQHSLIKSGSRAYLNRESAFPLAPVAICRSQEARPSKGEDLSMASTGTPEAVKSMDNPWAEMSRVSFLADSSSAASSSAMKVPSPTMISPKASWRLYSFKSSHIWFRSSLPISRQAASMTASMSARLEVPPALMCCMSGFLTRASITSSTPKPFRRQSATMASSLQ
mmetsp:Transcript_9002/g.20023  ORF Transcript_9002/g.20023 Transcript_9002/m.20023 type:complete len:200 (+) Transcript_9002:1360-1959(+)